MCSGTAATGKEQQVIQLTDINTTLPNYYWLTLFESLQDCYINLEYVMPDGSQITFKQYHNNREIHSIYSGGLIRKFNFDRNLLVFFGSVWADEDDFSTTIAYDLMGDEMVFNPTEFSRVEPSDSLALVTSTML